MSCVWQECPGNAWNSIPLPAGNTLDGTPLGLAGVAFCSLGQASAQGAALLVRPGVWVRVNGRPVLGGVHVLEHKDEILVAGGRLFFSMETTPVAVPFRLAAGAPVPTCPICRGPIKDGQQAVQCPGCSRWFHQLDAAEGRPAKPCWTYAPTCRFCNHPTSFAAESAWKPETEEAHV
jgi:hypothetical protein